MTYEFDRLITDHLEGEKLALWESVAKNVGSFAYNAARSAVPFLGKSTGAGVAGTLGYNAGAIKDAVKSVPGSFHVTSQQPAYKPQSTLKLAGSPSELTDSPSELVPFKHAYATALKKVASDWHRPVNIASYGAFALPYLFPSIHDNQKLTTALNTAGLLGLGATSAHSLAQGDPMSLYDLGGLGLMGAGVLHSALRPQQHHQ